MKYLVCLLVLLAVLSIAGRVTLNVLYRFFYEVRLDGSSSRLN